MNGDDQCTAEVERALEAWGAELVQIEKQIVELNERHAALFQKVSAAAEFIEKLHGGTP